jgi:hypothetical protein
MTNVKEIFNEALISDISDTLFDRRNNLLKSNQTCYCKNNLEYALGEIKRNPENSINVFLNLEKYWNRKDCVHIWYRERSMAASWDVLQMS